MQRIAGILLALAMLAEEAASSTLRIRRHLLGLLGPAEAATRIFLTGCGGVRPALLPVTFGASGSGDAARGSSDGPDHAARLAQQFRALAAVFVMLALLALRCAAGQPGRLPQRLLDAARRVGPIAALRPRYADTS